MVLFDNMVENLRINQSKDNGHVSCKKEMIKHVPRRPLKEMVPKHHLASDISQTKPGVWDIPRIFFPSTSRE